ncbi:oxidoreductase [Glycomyces albidus]|uniref:Oxidoreductase n=1 Tax=Glycomyces albidus TaxID=2656774 RepID=A0A6L5GA02_9ACTN|nr:oxidoreductase [Glycomyces albidus]MQM26383.1 oxidoreductase [Glycomyces albidus]
MDPLAPLLELSEVADALENARANVDRMLWHEALRGDESLVETEVALHSASATLALDGYDCDVERLRAGDFDDPVVSGVLAVTDALPSLADVWPVSPRYVLAKLHLLATRDFADAGVDFEPGRIEVDESGSARINALCALITNPTKEIPAAMAAAVVHGELLSVRPFPVANNVVARAAARLALASKGLDPKLLITVDAGHLERQPEYVGAQRAWSTGTPDGVRAWLKHYGKALEAGAAETLQICSELMKDA